MKNRTRFKKTKGWSQFIMMKLDLQCAEMEDRFKNRS